MVSEIELTLLIYRNKKLRDELVKLFMLIDKYCEESSNGKKPARKGYWADVEAQYLKIKREIENAKIFEAMDQKKKKRASG